MSEDIIDKLAYVYIKDKKILMTLSKGKATWYIPGGKREKDETDIEALKREVKEEMMIDLVPETIKYYGTFSAQAHGKPKGTMVRMTCYTADYEGEPKPSTEIEDISFCDYSIRDDLGPVDQIIFDDLKEKDVIE